MENEMKFKKLYLSEFVYHDGAKNITMNIVAVCTMRDEIAIAITEDGRISVQKFELKSDDTGRFYFEYGLMLDEIALDDFEVIKKLNQNY